MPNLTIKLKIAGIPKDYATMPFGRQLEYRKVIADFKLCANSCWLSQKRTTSGRAIREAIKLLDVAEYFCQFHDEPTYRDDTFEFFYTKKQS